MRSANTSTNSDTKYNIIQKEHLFRTNGVIVGLAGDAAEVQPLPEPQVDVRGLRRSPQVSLELAEAVRADAADAAVRPCARASLRVAKSPRRVPEGPQKSVAVR